MVKKIYTCIKNTIKCVFNVQNILQLKLPHEKKSGKGAYQMDMFKFNQISCYNRYVIFDVIKTK